MKIKNISFEVVEAVEEDMKTMTRFMPMEEKEVTKIAGDFFIGRYGDKYFKWVDEIKAEPVVVEEEELICDICGQVCATKSGLSAHRRSHK